ncbi:MAG: hypothetical protein AB1725_12755 [Armatimonadota bacterium]
MGPITGLGFPVPVVVEQLTGSDEEPEFIPVRVEGRCGSSTELVFPSGGRASLPHDAYGFRMVLEFAPEGRIVVHRSRTVLNPPPNTGAIGVNPTTLVVHPAELGW